MKLDTGSDYCTRLRIAARLPAIALTIRLLRSTETLAFVIFPRIPATLARGIPSSTSWTLHRISVCFFLPTDNPVEWTKCLLITVNEFDPFDHLNRETLIRDRE